MGKMQQEVIKTQTSPADVSKGTILVVDDDEFSRDLLSRRMERAGYQVTAIGNGGKVSDLLDRYSFDLILLDVVMPLISGREVLTSIRAKRSSSELPVIMVTSKTEGAEIAECFRRGANDYVTKPFETQALIARIEVHIARRRAEAALKHSQDDLERRVQRRTADLQRANRELEDARNILTDALEAINDGFVLWDSDNSLVACNQRYREFYGRNAPAVVPGAKFEDLMRMQAEGGALRGALGRSENWLEQRLARHRAPTEPFEEEFSDGTWAQMSETRASSGRTVGLCTDITGIKRREIALKTFAQTNRRLAAAVNATDSAILITDPARPGNPTVFANPAFATMTGWPVEEALGRDRKMLAGAGTDKDEVGRLEASMRAGVAASSELKLCARDGRPFWVEINASPIRNNDGEVVNWVIIQTDITARKETEEQLNQSQKMEIIGQLTGGLAHDFNNLLTVVLGNLEFVLTQDTPPDGEVREHIDAAFDASKRGAELTKRMLAFSRRQALAPRLTDLRRTVGDFRDFLDRSLGNGTGLETRLGEGVWPVLVDRGQLENAILNLAVNARDAMGNSGKVAIEVVNRTMKGAADVTDQAIPDGDYVCVAVSDTGGGMTKEVMSKATQPFFTTKESGKGTGLGLSMVYGFTSQSKGFLRIESQPGKGTTMELIFPRVSACAAIEQLGSEVVAEGGSETLLLVDDEPQVRTIAAIQLKRLGYEILQAEDGHEALEILGRTPGVNLLVTDIGLPGGMSGLDLAAAVRQQNPAIPVLYVSGYSDGSSSESAEEDPEAQFLAKPYDKQALAAAVRRALAMR
jgi:PAS domain S-box-containing protein